MQGCLILGPPKLIGVLITQAITKTSLVGFEHALYPIPITVDQNCLGKNTNQLCVQFRDLIGWLARLTLVCIWFVFLPCNWFVFLPRHF
jgi:hypothetical protein